MILKTWSEFKAICTKKSLSIQFEQFDSGYRVYGPDANALVWEIFLPLVIPDEQGNAIPNPDRLDFETNFKATANSKITQVQVDSDGAPMSRVKVAPSGWSYQLRMFEFQSSVVGSTINRDANKRDLSDAKLTLLSADGQEIADQGAADTDCARTMLDIEPPYDYYIVGGNVKTGSEPNLTTYVNVMGAPDIPAQFGGSKVFVQNVNLRYIQIERGVEADGRAAKWLQYNPTLHTNKLRFMFDHEPGYKLAIAIFLELYKA